MELEPLADVLGVRVMESPALNPKINGIYLHQRRTIVLRAGLDPWNYRSTLAHELGHAYYQDPPGYDPKAERRADRFAAQILISEEAYRRAEHLCEGHLGAIAYELGVTPHVVEVWRALHGDGMRVPGILC